METKPYDLIVIGGGPAGYAAAIRAGQLGKRVACIEYERAGGTCLNWGCIPSKALLKAAELYHSILSADCFGLHCEDVAVDFPKVIGRSRGVADKMGRGIEFLFRKNKVDYFLGRGHIARPGVVTILEGQDVGKTLEASAILVATGCCPRTLPNIEVDGARVLTSREALKLRRCPKSLTILGAGAIGIEFAYFFNAFGSKVTLLEQQSRILPQEDGEVAMALERSLKKQGIEVLTGTTTKEIFVKGQSVAMELDQKGESSILEAESLLIAIGVVPNTQDLLSDKMQPALEKGYIQVNNRYQTNLPHLYAAGDIIGPPWLAHVATFEAIQAVNGIFDHSEPKRVGVFPSCTYCQPQVASVGATEEQLKSDGRSYQVGKFPFQASGKAVAIDHPDGFVKVLVDPDYGEILGAHIIGAEATELIQEYALAIENELTVHDIHRTIHAHPTLSETLAEAVSAVNDEAIHI